ncbi:hypothetical protein D3Z39_15460 [Anaerotruncus colihominis]|uniref:Uncharacterized protein n=1 Tax=Anaerotruncus colihominis TaxID=169435 RepID=A0A845RL05_9FIRM|nr:hypothetical protein [Anaerotruncus colihominis]
MTENVENGIIKTALPQTAHRAAARRIEGQPPAGAVLRPKTGGSIVPPKGGVRMEYLIMLVVILLVLDSIFRNKKR